MKFQILSHPSGMSCKFAADKDKIIEWSLGVVKNKKNWELN